MSNQVECVDSGVPTPKAWTHVPREEGIERRVVLDVEEGDGSTRCARH